MPNSTSTPATSNRRAASSRKRQPSPEGIDYGSRARIGLIVASGNFIAEPQIRAMLPAGVEVYVTRLPLRGSSVEEFLAMAAQVDGAAALLRDAGVDRVVFHCTAVSTYSLELAAAIDAQLRRHGPGFSTAEAVVAGLRNLGARRLVLLSPYIPAVNEAEVAFLQARGFEVLGAHGLGVATNAEMGGLPPSAFVEQALRNRDEWAEAYFISCTAIRSAEVIETLEAQLGRPVVTSNQASVWHMLRACGIDDAVQGFGRLLRQ